MGLLNATEAGGETICRSSGRRSSAESSSMAKGMFAECFFFFRGGGSCGTASSRSTSGGNCDLHLKAKCVAVRKQTCGESAFSSDRVFTLMRRRRLLVVTSLFEIAGTSSIRLWSSRCCLRALRPTIAEEKKFRPLPATGVAREYAVTQKRRA